MPINTRKSCWGFLMSCSRLIMAALPPAIRAFCDYVLKYLDSKNMSLDDIKRGSYTIRTSLIQLCRRLPIMR